MLGKMIIKLFALLKGYDHNYRVDIAVQTIAQIITSNAMMLWVSADIHPAPPLANMRFTNGIHISGYYI